MLLATATRRVAGISLCMNSATAFTSSSKTRFIQNSLPCAYLGLYPIKRPRIDNPTRSRALSCADPVHRVAVRCRGARFPHGRMPLGMLVHPTHPRKRQPQCMPLPLPGIYLLNLCESGKCRPAARICSLVAVDPIGWPSVSAKNLCSPRFSAPCSNGPTT